MESIGDYLRGKREAKGLGLRQLAGRMRYDYGTISKIECDKMEPSETFLIGASRHLKLTQEESDELFAMAGRLPPDIKPMALLGKGMFRIFRAVREKGR